MNQTTNIAWDCYIGKQTNYQDINLISTGYSYTGDPFDRLLLVKRALGNAAETHTAFSYPNLTTSTTRQDVYTLNDGVFSTTIFYDGLGRQIRSQRSDGIVVTQSYDALGRPYQTSFPYNPGSEVQHFRTTTYDGAGRIHSVATDDGATTVNSYNGNQTTTTDPAGAARTATMDGLGRLTSVVEDPGPVPAHLNYATSYTYDLLDNLTSVTQGTLSLRQFTYNSLRQLVTAVNPENGTICYGIKNGSQCTESYDENGNLLSRVDNQGIITSYTYDELNRLLTKSYTPNTTPQVTFTYNGSNAACPYNLGRLSNVSTVATAAAPATSENFYYDALGRTCSSDQAIGTSAPYRFSYGYNLAGGLTSETYPSLRVVNSTFDGVNRPATVTSGSTTYVNAVTYSSNDAPAQIKFGPATAVIATQTTTFDQGPNNHVRQQPTQIAVTTATAAPLTLKYSYCPRILTSCSSNNGNVVSAGIVTPSLNLSQGFLYDAANRLTWASETGGTSNEWSQGYSYDQWGNRAVTSGFMPNPYATPTSLGQYVNNQWWGAGAGYDAAGNQNALSSRSYSYDAENRLITSTQPSIGTIQYTYDGEGRRVTKTVGSTTTVFVYDGAGQLAAEYGSSSASGIQYMISDMLGSTRLMLKGDGSVAERIDYLPFGEELAAGVGGRTSDYSTGSYPPAPNDLVTQKFTGKERDAETGFDYFGARYFSGAQGRFTSPDEFPGGIVDPFTGQQVGQPGPLPYADITDPQTLNKYAYVRNNPLRYVDPDGHCGLIGHGEICESFADFKASLSDRIIGGLKFLANGPASNFGYEFKASNAEQQDAMNSAESAMPVAGLAMAFIPGGKGGKTGARTEPTLPGKTIVAEEGVTVQHYTRSGDHGPAHLHVKGEGAETRIGQNGNPMKGDPPLSPAQAQVVQQNKATIRGAVDKIMRWFDYNRQQEGR